MRPSLIVLCTALALAPAAALAQEAAAPAAAPTPAAPQPVPGGGTFAADRTIADNVAAARALSQTEDAIKAADLSGLLSGAGPLTLFAPSNSGWDGLRPKSLQPELMRDRARAVRLLNFHVVQGAVTSADLAERVKKGNGEAYLTTVEGGTITVRAAGRGFQLTDVNGAKAKITFADGKASNGVIHIIDAVLQP